MWDLTDVVFSRGAYDQPAGRSADDVTTPHRREKA
jgi:hypothetical protein